MMEYAMNDLKKKEKMKMMTVPSVGAIKKMIDGLLRYTKSMPANAK